MAKRLKAMGRPEYQDAVNGDGRWTGKITLVPDRLDQPLRWRKPRMVFVNSMSDLFHEDVPDVFLHKIFKRMTVTNHTFQVLTKRPERMNHYVNGHAPGLARFPNVWLGVTVENQQAADERIPLLLQTPAAVRFLSCEPLLSEVLLRRWVPPSRDWPDCGIHWLIAGCESGPNRRLAEWEWFKSLKDEAVAAGIPFFLKQAGNDRDVIKMPILDGRTWDQMPTDNGPLTLALGAGGALREKSTIKERIGK